MNPKLPLFFSLVVLAPNLAHAETLLTVDARLNCINIIAPVGYVSGGGPVILRLASGQYVVEAKSSTADYCGYGNTCPVKEALVWYGSRTGSSTTWYQSVRLGQPVVIDHNPEYALYAVIPDLYCTNNIGATVLSVRRVSP